MRLVRCGLFCPKVGVLHNLARGLERSPTPWGVTTCASGAPFADSLWINRCCPKFSSVCDGACFLLIGLRVPACAVILCIKRIVPICILFILCILCIICIYCFILSLFLHLVVFFFQCFWPRCCYCSSCCSGDSSSGCSGSRCCYRSGMLLRHGYASALARHPLAAAPAHV